MTEQEIFDEYMRLCNLQNRYGRNNSKGFSSSDSICDQVYTLMDKMRDIGLKENKTVGRYFRNWFFICKDRTFSICVYANGYMELRWG
jgi:hypothetical protein